MNKRAKIATALGAATVLAGIGAGVSYADSIPSPVTGEFTGCYNSTGALRVINVGARCAANEATVTWNQKGPQGIQGSPAQSVPRALRAPSARREFLATRVILETPERPEPRVRRETPEQRAPHSRRPS